MAGRRVANSAPYWEYAEFPRLTSDPGSPMDGALVDASVTKHAYYHRPGWLTIPGHGVIEAWVHKDMLDTDSGDGIMAILDYYCRMKKRERTNAR